MSRPNIIGSRESCALHPLHFGGRRRVLKRFPKVVLRSPKRAANAHASGKFAWNPNKLSPADTYRGAARLCAMHNLS